MPLFRQADTTFEECIGVRFPTGLDFSSESPERAAQSKRQFAGYLDRKGKLVAKARDQYQHVIRSGDKEWAVAASARIGQLFRHFGDELAVAPVPRPPIPTALKGKARQEFIAAFVETYCQTTQDKSKPLLKKAREAFAVCIAKAKELRVESQWSKLCEAEQAADAPR